MEKDDSESKKKEIRRLRRRIFLKSASSAEEAEFKKLSGIDPASIVRESCEQRNRRLEQDRVRARLRKVALTGFMSEAEYESMMDIKYDSIARPNQRWEFETRRQGKIRRKKDAERARKRRGVWRSQDPYGTELPEQREARLEKDRVRNARNLATEAKGEKERRLKAIRIRRKLREAIDLSEDEKTQLCAWLDDNTAYERPRIESAPAMPPGIPRGVLNIHFQVRKQPNKLEIFQSAVRKKRQELEAYGTSIPASEKAFWEDHRLWFTALYQLGKLNVAEDRGWLMQKRDLLEQNYRDLQSMHYLQGTKSEEEQRLRYINKFYFAHLTAIPWLGQYGDDTVFPPAIWWEKNKLPPNDPFDYWRRILQKNRKNLDAYGDSIPTEEKGFWEDHRLWFTTLESAGKLHRKEDQQWLKQKRALLEQNYLDLQSSGALYRSEETARIYYMCGQPEKRKGSRYIAYIQDGPCFDFLENRGRPEKYIIRHHKLEEYPEYYRHFRRYLTETQVAIQVDQSRKPDRAATCTYFQTASQQDPDLDSDSETDSNSDSDSAGPSKIAKENND